MIKGAICFLALCCACTGARAQSANHLGGTIFAPPQVQPGSSSLFFTPGGTEFLQPNGAMVFVPTQTFTPYPTTTKQLRELTIPGPNADSSDPNYVENSNHGEKDTFQEILERHTRGYGMSMAYIEDINFNGMLEELDFSIHEPKAPRPDNSPGFDPVPPSDAPTPSVDEARVEID